MPLKIIGAGLPRTGTSSLKFALEDLGFVKCYHMSELYKNLEHLEFWNHVVHQDAVDWKTFFSDYQAAVDYPSSLFYQDLVQTYPNAKVILTIRNPSSWYDSITSTVMSKDRCPTRWKEAINHILAPFNAYHRTRRRWHSLLRLMWQTVFDEKYKDKDEVIKRFQAHIDEVKQFVPAEKLLIFDVREGWEPLCSFLEVPVPNHPFPHANDRATTQESIKVLSKTGHWDVNRSKAST